MDALENLDVWKRACSLSVDIYKSLQLCNDSGFKDQVSRSALSIPSNIAEGYERDSIKSCIQYLTIAKGSCGELWTQLLIGRKVGFVTADTGRRLEKEAREISKMLFGLIKHYKEIKD
jgi:four helix bundle protein